MTKDTQDREKALVAFDNGFDSYEVREYALNGPQTGKTEGQLYFFWPEDVQQIRAALQSGRPRDTDNERLRSLTEKQVDNLDLALDLIVVLRGDIRDFKKEIAIQINALTLCTEAMNDYLNGKFYNKETGKVDTYFSGALHKAEKAIQAHKDK